MDIYAENILEHYRDPRNTGTGESASCTGTEENPACGDKLTVHLYIADGVILNVEWQGEGCAISQAGMSILSEELMGKTISDVLTMDKAYIDALLGVPIGQRRFKCALLCLHTVKNTLLKAEGKPPQSWLVTMGAT